MERVPGLLNCPIVHISVLQFQLYLVLLPVDGQTIPNLEKPYLSCQSTLSIQHLVQVIDFSMDLFLDFFTFLVYRVGLKQLKDVKSTFFQIIALQLSRKVEELEMYIRMDRHQGSVGTMASSTGEFDGLERLREDKLLSDLHPSFASSNGNMVRPSIEAPTA